MPSPGNKRVTKFGIEFHQYIAVSKKRLTSKFLCQEENHENPVFLVATIVVGIMIEWFCLYASIQTKSSHHSTTLTWQQPENRKKQENYVEPNWLYTVHFSAQRGFSFEKVGILIRMRWCGCRLLSVCLYTRKKIQSHHHRRSLNLNKSGFCRFFYDSTHV